MIRAEEKNMDTPETASNIPKFFTMSADITSTNEEEEKVSEDLYRRYSYINTPGHREFL